MSAKCKIGSKFYNLNSLKPYDSHKLVKYIEDEESGLRGIIAIHRTNGKHPSFGATRMWEYAKDEDALKDALRLSKLMTYKSAMAGLDCGGAKGVIMHNPEGNGDKASILKAYAQKVNELEGMFVTGTDVGLTQKDILGLQKDSPYFVGLRVNPTLYTAYGVLEAIQTALDHVYNSRKLSKRSFAIQGIGKIGTKLLDLLYSEAKEIFVTDIDMRRLRAIKQKYPRVTVVDVDEIHSQEVDIFSPCALGLAINEDNISEIKAKLIIGGANNQLESPEIGQKLAEMGILYVPDYVANAGGLISVVSEYYNKDIEPDELMGSICKIGDRTNEILKKNLKTETPTNIIADRLARKATKSYEKAEA